MDINLESLELGKAIKTARLENNYSQEKFAEIIGITVKHLQHLEYGNRFPSLSVLYKIAMASNLSVDNVFFKNTKGRPAEKKAEILMKKCDNKNLKIIISMMEILLDIQE